MWLCWANWRGKFRVMTRACGVPCVQRNTFVIFLLAVGRLRIGRRGISSLASVLELGACRQIQDGQTSFIWSDPWVMGLESFHPIPRLMLGPDQLLDRVSALILPVSRQWNRVLLSQ